MRLLYVDPLGIEGGMGGYADAVLPAYARAGFAIQVLTTSASSSVSAVSEVEVSRLYRIAFDRSRTRVVRALAYVAGSIEVLKRSIRRDVILFHFLHWPIVDAALMLMLRGIGKRVVLVAHDPVPVVTGETGRAYRMALRGASLIVVHGRHAERDILRLGVAKRKLARCGFGDFPAPESVSDHADLKLLGLRDLRRPVAAIIGNLKPGKGIARAIAAMDASTSPVHTLLVAGKQQGTWPLDEEIAKAIHLNVVRIDGRLSLEQELAAYRLSDVVLVLYEWGYSSGVIARAHSVGRPVVLTDVGDLAEQRGDRDVVLGPGYSSLDLSLALAKVLNESRHGLRIDLEPWDQQAQTVADRLMPVSIREGS